jgi:subfamily B ATP-binding cassette protein HlyB/CyaB
LEQACLAREEVRLARENVAKSRYYRLIAGAVDGLEHNTVDARHVVYERARNALSAWVRHCNPPLARAEVARERQALEDAVRFVEADANRQQRQKSASPKRAGRPFRRTRSKIANCDSRSGKSFRNRCGLVLNRISSSVLQRGKLQLRWRWRAAAPQLGVPVDEMPAQGSQSREPFRDLPSAAQPVLDDVHAGSPEVDRGPAPASRNGQPHSRLQAMIQAARYHGIELDAHEFRRSSEAAPSAAELSLWAQNAGMWSRAVRTRWRHLLRFNDTGPVVLLFKDGSAGLLTGADAARMVVFVKDPGAPASAAPVAIDELRLSQVWAGEAVLLRPSRGFVTADALFNLRWLVDLVLQERQSLRDIGLASLTISLLTIFPPLLVMAMVNKVLQFHSVSTLVLLSVMMVVAFAYETLLGYARRLIIAVVGARLDAKLNLHVFNRLLRLPLDYFERHPAGETMYRIAQVYRVREFLTGRLLTTFLDLVTLAVLLPFLLYLNATLAGIVLACAVAIALIILTYLRPMRDMYGRVALAETCKSATLGETIVGIKTVKALALEPQRKALWDERVAETGKWRLAFGRLANWPQTLVNPIERVMVLGTMMIGAYMAMNDSSGYLVGGLFAFLMLSQRVAQPLVGLARLIEDYEEVGAAIGEAGSVLNRPLESAAGSVGLRPQLVGAINFQNVTFTYANTKVPALDQVSFSVPAGTMLGIVGRSGSGKSTITRLLQGINRDYSGFLKIDGSELRDIDLRHLRQSLGVVLQDNFLFRGSIRDNIIAGRPGLTLADAVHAARLAGAEEFIERMPNGYETYIEEGSPNLSGGQRQRLAIARALVCDPRILILDEATSALDPESEAVVTANLLRIASGRTMIIVSHRLASLITCDQILVLEQGGVVGIGPHSELTQHCGIYRQLWAQQNRHVEGQASRRPATAGPRLVSGGLTES